MGRCCIFFYSGYGVMESLKVKGNNYLNDFAKKRLGTTLLNFDVAVCCFFLLNYMIGKTLTIEDVLLSLIGWSSVGNSNWYIFVILLCYLAFYISFGISKERGTVLCVTYNVNNHVESFSGQRISMV